jgi:hypothetical protein
MTRVTECSEKKLVFSKSTICTVKHSGATNPVTMNKHHSLIRQQNVGKEDLIVIYEIVLNL